MNSCLSRARVTEKVELLRPNYVSLGVVKVAAISYEIRV
jgi:hypothetical protein